MFDPAAWRDADSESRRIGFYVTRNALTIYIGKRCYRVRWTGQWTK